MSKAYTAHSENKGGRVFILFLLFLLALYALNTSGFGMFAAICISPIVIILAYVIFSWRSSAFWALVVVNYFLQMKNVTLPSGIPMSLYNEMIMMVLLGAAIIDARKTPHFERSLNLMLLSILIWCGFCTLELLNDTCGLGISVSAWYNVFRLMALQMLLIFLVFSIYISSPENLKKYIYIWLALSLFSVFWTWKQKTYGFTQTERIWLETVGRRTHILQGGTLIRYFSTHNDAASYGCNAAATGVAFLIFAISTKFKREKIFFLISSILIIWGMFQSGTRTGIFSLFGGLLVYVFLSKSFKIAIPFSISVALFMSLLAFTDIGNGNQQIRRMRTAFDKNDASASVRDINKAAIKKYLQDAPWGLGIATKQDAVPANNKFNKLINIPPDSEYVFIWVRTGVIGVSVFTFTSILMLLGACAVVFFKLKNKSLIGIGGGLCSAFVAIHLGGYANQILLNYPNFQIFYGGLAIVYVLPFIEPEWTAYEQKKLEEQEERKRLKLEKKRASRV